MRRTSSVAALAVAVVALAASVAVSPAAGAPPGQGLVTTPLVLNCEGAGETTVTTIPGGPPGTGPAWVTTTGVLALVREITVTNAGNVVFAKTYGNKTPLGATFTCTATLPNGFFFEAELVTIT